MLFKTSRLTGRHSDGTKINLLIKIQNQKHRQKHPPNCFPVVDARDEYGVDGECHAGHVEGEELLKDGVRVAADGVVGGAEERAHLQYFSSLDMSQNSRCGN